MVEVFILSTLYKSISENLINEVTNLDLSLSPEFVNNEISALLEKTVLADGKRLRPLLTFLIGDLIGLEMAQIRPLARAVELIHAASLSHDDVIDNATTRRNKCSINVVGSNKKAVLAGDYLLSDVICGLSSLGNSDLIQEMAKVFQELSEGEWLQIRASEYRKYSHEIIEQIAAKKTGSLMSFCCVAPAIVAKVSKAHIELCREFGTNLGIGFQLLDDTLDFSAQSSKDKHIDWKNGVINSVTFEWLQENPLVMSQYHDRGDVEQLVKNANVTKATQKVKEISKEKIAKARAILGTLGNNLSIKKNSVDCLETLLTSLEKS